MIKSLFVGIVNLLIIGSCTFIPKGVNAVKPFYKEKFVGRWYEIARLDFKFERGFSNVSAVYSLNDDGTIKVFNQGYNMESKLWEEVYGKAKFVGDPKEGRLKVTFFYPFYSGYNVIAVDDNYHYMMVAGKSREYLWILSRQKTIPDSVKNQYLQLARDYGFNTSELLWVVHDKPSIE